MVRRRSPPHAGWRLVREAAGEPRVGAQSCRQRAPGGRKQDMLFQMLSECSQNRTGPALCISSTEKPLIEPFDGPSNSANRSLRAVPGLRRVRRFIVVEYLQLALDFLLHRLECVLPFQQRFEVILLPDNGAHRK